MGDLGEAAILDSETISKIVTNVRTRGGLGRGDPIIPAQEVGAVRPAATLSEMIERRNSLSNYRHAHNEISMRKTGKPWRMPEIRPSDRSYKGELKPEYLVMMRLLTTGEYKKEISTSLAGELVARRWGKEIFVSEQNEPNFDVKDLSNNVLPRELIERLDKDETLDNVQKRAAFVKAILNTPEYLAVRRQIFGEEIKKMRPEEWDILVADAVGKLIAKLRKKDDKSGKGEKVTKGVEIEILQPKGANFVKILPRLDAVQDLQIPVNYDGVREFPLPFSASTRDQLRAIYEMIKSGVISEGYGMNFHINLGGANWRNGIPEALEMLQICDAALLMNVNQLPVSQSDGKEPGIYWTHAESRKPLVEDSYHVRGMPIKIRDSGVLELRWMGPVGGVSWRMLIAERDKVSDSKKKELLDQEFREMARDMINIGAISEAAAAHIRLETHKSIDPEKDIQLAQVWEWAKLENRSLIDKYSKKYRLKDTQRIYDDVRTYDIRAPDLEDRYAVSRFNFIDASKKNPIFRKEYKGILREVRKRVREIQREDEE